MVQPPAAEVRDLFPYCLSTRRMVVTLFSSNIFHSKPVNKRNEAELLPRPRQTGVLCWSFAPGWAPPGAPKQTRLWQSWTHCSQLITKQDFLFNHQMPGTNTLGNNWFLPIYALDVARILFGQVHSKLHSEDRNLTALRVLLWASVFLLLTAMHLLALFVFFLFPFIYVEHARLFF